MANLLEQMLAPAQSIQAQVPQSPQTPSAPHPQDSNAVKDIIGAVSTAASLAGLFIPPAAPIAAPVAAGSGVAAQLM